MNAAIYTRVSTLEQAQEGYSLTAQKDKLLKYAEAMNYNVVGVFTDDGFSGKTLNRPEMQKLIQAVKTESINIVLIYKLDRLSRRVKDVLDLVELFAEHNVTLFSLSENLDLSSPFGRAALKMSATFSELERETIVERMRLGKDQKAKNGMASRKHYLPIGYDYDETTSKFVPRSDEKEQVLKMYQMYLQGATYAQISAYMRNNGYKNRYSSYKARTSPGKVLRNPFYAGYFIHNGEIYKANNIEPIIDYETWLKAEVIRLNTKKKLLLPGSPYLLTGLIYCGRCGNRYVSKKYDQVQVCANGNKHEYHRLCYGCTARVKRDKLYTKIPMCDNVIIKQTDLDNIIINAVKNLHFVKFKATTTGQQLNLINLQISELKESLEKLLDVYLSGIITKEQLQERSSKIEAEIALKEKALADMKSNVTPTPEVNADKINQRIKNWDNLDLYDKRQLLQVLIKKIVIDGENVNIEWLVDF